MRPICHPCRVKFDEQFDDQTALFFHVGVPFRLILCLFRFILALGFAFRFGGKDYGRGVYFESRFSGCDFRIGCLNLRRSKAKHVWINTRCSNAIYQTFFLGPEQLSETLLRVKN